MAMSIGGLGGSFVKPMNMLLKNQSKISDIYDDEIAEVSKIDTMNPIDPVNPVQYATAKQEAVNPVKQLEDNISASKSFNDIANSFAGAVTGYGSSANANMYQMIGNNFDTYI